MRFLSFQKPECRPIKAILSAAVLGIACSATLAAPQADDQPASATRPSGRRGDREQVLSISGSVLGYNLNPHGTVDGLLLKTEGGMVQLDVPPDVGPILAQIAKVDSQVTVTAIALPDGRGGPPQPGEGAGPQDPAHSDPDQHRGGPDPDGPDRPNPGGGPQAQVRADHPVYTMLTLTGSDGKQLTIPRPGDARTVHVAGTVKQMNYDRRGEVDGVQLDTGDLVHFGSGSAAQLNLAVAQQVTADGLGSPTVMGHLAVEASTVNGTVIRRPGPPRAHPGDRGPDDHDGATPGDHQGPHDGSAGDRNEDGARNGPDSRDDNGGPPPAPPTGN